MALCKTCNKKVTINEMGLNMKLISKEVDEFYCIDCLSDVLKISKNSLEKQIDFYISIGCTLFSKE